MLLFWTKQKKLCKIFSKLNLIVLILYKMFEISAINETCEVELSVVGIPVERFHVN